MERSLRVRSGTTTYYLSIPEEVTWVRVKENIAAILNLARKDVDFCLTLNASEGVKNDQPVQVDECFLVKRIGGKWVKPSWKVPEMDNVAVQRYFPDSLVAYTEEVRNTVFEK